MNDRACTTAQHCLVVFPHEEEEGGGTNIMVCRFNLQTQTIPLYRRINEQDLRKIAIASFFKSGGLEALSNMHEKVGVIVWRRVKSYMYEKRRGNCVEDG